MKERKWILWGVLVGFGVISGVCGLSQIGILAYDSRTNEYVCTTVSCSSSSRLLRACGAVPKESVVFSGLDNTLECIEDNKCNARDVMVSMVASGFSAGAAVSTSSSDCVDPNFELRNNAVLLVRPDGNASLSRFVGAGAARVNETRTVQNGPITAVIMAQNVTSATVTLKPAQYFESESGLDRDVPLANRAITALFTGLTLGAGLRECPFRRGENTDEDALASLAVLATNQSGIAIATEITGVQVESLEETAQQVLLQCERVACALNFGFGSPETLNQTVENTCRSNSPECFPADARVQLQDGTFKAMEELQAGDRVLTERGTFSDVYAFSHFDTDGMHEFVKLDTISGASVSLSRGHYIYLNGSLTAAEKAAVGDVVETGNGATDTITSIARVRRRGLINPHTYTGDVVVDGIRCSTFTRTVKPRVAQLMLLPLRLIYAVFGYGTTLSKPSPWLASLMPKGAIVDAT